MRESSPSRKSPLGRIALALSGGGYRAAAYHLGALDLLQRLDLLEDVTILSTVSGGTITGAAYAANLAEFSAGYQYRHDGKVPPPGEFGRRSDGYAAFYKRLHGFLGSVNVIEESLVALEPMLEKRCERSPKLINAAADVYDQKLFDGERFGKLYAAEEIHLQEVAFNATDFRSGLSFRFQKTNSRGLSGSFANKVEDPSVLSEIRMADIVAASSCFPAAFEPMAFPDDFEWDDLERTRTRLNGGRESGIFTRPVPLMDGGTADNQGIHSVLNAMGRKRVAPPDLVIVSDTDIYDYELYQYPAAECASSISWLSAGMTVAQAQRLGSWFLMAFLAWSAWLATSTWDTMPLPLYIGLIGVPLAIWGVLAVLPLAGYDMLVVEAQEALDGIVSGKPVDIEEWVGRFDVNQLREALLVRSGSLVSMAHSVFLKQIRSHVYHELYAQPRLEGKIIANLIYELHKKATDPKATTWPHISADMLEVVGRGMRMPTTLWFDPDDGPKLDDVVATGQICLCYNLLDHLTKLRRQAEDLTGYAELMARVARDWDALPRNVSAHDLPADEIAELADARRELAKWDEARDRWRQVSGDLYPRTVEIWERLLRDPFSLAKEAGEHAMPVREAPQEEQRRAA